jgi:antitoxin Phd
MKRWMLQTAKNKFSEVIERAQREGPQLVTRRGVDAAVVLSMDDFQALSGASGSDLVDFFRESPLGSLPEDLLTRTRDTGREVEL